MGIKAECLGILNLVNIKVTKFLLNLRPWVVKLLIIWEKR